MAGERRGASRQKSASGHPSVTFGDSSPQGEPLGCGYCKVAPPYDTNGQGSVGANSVRPCSLAATQDSAGMQCLPYSHRAVACRGRRPRRPGACACITGRYRIRPYGLHVNRRLSGRANDEHRPLQNGGSGRFGPGGVKLSGGGKRQPQNAAYFLLVFFLQQCYIYKSKGNSRRRMYIHRFFCIKCAFLCILCLKKQEK